MSNRSYYELEEGEIVSSDDALETDFIEQPHRVVADPVQKPEPIVEEQSKSIHAESAQQSEVISEAPAEPPDTVIVNTGEQPEAMVADTVKPIEVDPLNQPSSSVINLEEESTSSLESTEEQRMEVDAEQSPPDTEHAEIEVASVDPNDVVLPSDQKETIVEPTSQKTDHSISPTPPADIGVPPASSQPKYRREEQNTSSDSEASEGSTDDDPEYLSPSSSEEQDVGGDVPSDAAELLYVEHGNVTVNYADECVEEDEEYVEDEEQGAEDDGEYAEDGQEYGEDEEIDAEDGEQISEDEDIEHDSEAHREPVAEIALEDSAELNNEQYEDSDDADYVEDDDEQYVEDDDEEYAEDDDEEYAEDDGEQYSNGEVEHEAYSAEDATVIAVNEDVFMVEQHTVEQLASGNVDQYAESHFDQPAESEAEPYMTTYYEEMETEEPATSGVPQYFEERYSDYEESVADEPTISGTPDNREEQHESGTPSESIDITETEEVVKEPGREETEQPSEVIHLSDTETPEAEQRTDKAADEDVIFEGVTSARASVEVVDSTEQHQETLPTKESSQSVIDLTGDEAKEGTGKAAVTEQSGKEIPLIDKIKSYTWSRTDPRADILIVSGSSSDELQNDTIKNNYVDRVIPTGPNAEVTEISGSAAPPNAKSNAGIENEEMEVDGEEGVPQPGTAEEPIEIDEEPQQTKPSCYRPSRDDSSDQADVEDNDDPLHRERDSESPVLPLHTRRRRKALARHARVVERHRSTELDSESESGDSVKCLKASIKNHRCEQVNCMAAGSNLYVKYQGAYHHGLQATEFTDCLGNTYDLIVQDPEAGQMTTIDIKEYKEIDGKLEYLSTGSSCLSSSNEEPGTDDEYVIKQIANKLNGNIDQYDVEYDPDYLSEEEFDAVEQATAEVYESLNLLDDDLVASLEHADQDEEEDSEDNVNSNDEPENDAVEVIVISDDEPENEVTTSEHQQEETTPPIVETFDDETEAERPSSAISQANTAVTVISEPDDNGSFVSSGSGRLSHTMGCSPVAFDPSWFDLSGDDGPMEGSSGVYYDPYDYYDPFVWDEDAVPPTERFQPMTYELEEVRIIPISVNGEKVQVEADKRRAHKVIPQKVAKPNSAINKETLISDAVKTIMLQMNDVNSREGADNQSDMEVDDPHVGSALSPVVDETISATDATTKIVKTTILDSEHAISPTVEEPMSASDGETAVADEVETITLESDDADSEAGANIQSPMEVDLTSENVGDTNEATTCHGEDHEDMEEASDDDAVVSAEPTSIVEQPEYYSEEVSDEQDEDVSDEDELSTSDPSDCDYLEPTSKIEHSDYNFDEDQYEYDSDYTEIDPARLPRFCDPFVHNYVPREKPAYMHKTNINRPILASEQLCNELAKGKSANYGLIDPIEKELANAMRMNYQMQISLIEEISRLVCNGRAEYEQLGPIPNLEPSECIHPESPVKPLSYATELCSEKEPLKMYVHEVWWAWIESHLPEFSSDDVDQLRDELEKMTVGCVREDSDESVIDDKESESTNAEEDEEEVENSDAENAEETCSPDSDDEVTYELDLSEISQYLKDGRYTIQLVTQDDGEGGTHLTAEIVENEDDDDEEDGDYLECDEEIDQEDDDYGQYQEDVYESGDDEEESVEGESEEDTASQAAEEEGEALDEGNVSSPDSDPAYSDPDGALYFAEKLNLVQPDNEEHMEDDIPREQAPTQESKFQELKIPAHAETTDEATLLKETSPTAEITVCQNVEATTPTVYEETHETEITPHLPVISIVESAIADPQEAQQSTDNVVDDANDSVIADSSNESVASDESESTFDEQDLSDEDQEQWRVLENLVELQIIENNELAGGTDEEDSDYEDSDEESIESDTVPEEEDISMDEVMTIRKEVIDDFGESLLEDSRERTPTPETCSEELMGEEVSIAEAVPEEASAEKSPVRETSEVPVSDKASSEEIATADSPVAVVIETSEPEASNEDKSAEGYEEYMSVSEGESVHSEDGSEAEDVDFGSQDDEAEDYYEDDDADLDSEADDAEDEYDQSSVEDESDYEDEEYEDEEDEDAIFYEAESAPCSECSESDSEKREETESPNLHPVGVTVINDFLPDSYTEENDFAEAADDLTQRKRRVSSSPEPPPLKSIDPLMLHYRERRKRHDANMTVKHQKRTKRYRRQETLTPSRIRSYQWTRGDSSDESTVSTPPLSLRQNARLPAAVKRPKTTKMRMRRVKKLRPYLYHSFDPKDFRYNEKGERLRRRAENLRRRKWNLAPLPDLKPLTKKPVVNHPIPLLKTLPKNRNTRLRSLQTAYVSGDDSDLDDDKEVQFDLKSEDDLSEYWKSDDEEKFETGPNFLTKLRAMKREVVAKQWTVSVDRSQIHPRPRRAPIPVEIREGEMINVSKKFAEMVLSDSEDDVANRPLSTSPSPHVADDDERTSPASESSEPSGYGIEKIRPTAKSPPPSNSEYILASTQKGTPTPSDRSTSSSYEKSPPSNVSEKTSTSDRSMSNTPLNPTDLDDERMSMSPESFEPESPLSQTEKQEGSAAHSKSNTLSEQNFDMERMSQSPENDEPESTTSLTQVIRVTAKSPPPCEKDVSSISSVLIRPTVTSPPPPSGKPAYAAFVRPQSTPPPELAESSQSDDEEDDEYNTEDNEDSPHEDRIIEFVEEVGLHDNGNIPEHLEKYCTPLNPADGSSSHDTWKDILKQPPPPDHSFSFMGLDLEPEIINNLLAAGVLAINPETNKVYDTTENETILNIKGPAEPVKPEVSDEEEPVDEEEAEIDRELAEVQAQLEAAALQLKTQNNTILRLMKDQAKRQELSEMLKKTEATLFDNADADPDEGDPYDMAFAYDDLYSYYKNQNYGELIQKRAQRHEDAKAFEQFKGFPTGY